MSASCSGPSGEVAQARISPPERCASSIEAPPMSQTRPSASGQPRSTPLAASRASSEPLATWSCRPVSRSTWSQKAGPSTASRTAAVATAIRPESSIRPARRREPVQRRQRLDPALGAEPPGLAEAGAEAAEHLLVVEIGRAARHAVEDDEAHRVRPDVDDADALQPGLGGFVDPKPGQLTDPLCRHWCPRPAGFRRRQMSHPRGGLRQSWPCTSWMTSRAPARPRPESEGFSMKKRWQEKRCSPGRASWRR